jgi:hypothetical protein
MKRGSFCMTQKTIVIRLDPRSHTYDLFIGEAYAGWSYSHNVASYLERELHGFNEEAERNAWIDIHQASAAHDAFRHKD